MEDPGYTSYQDGRLTPPDVADDDAPTPAECWEGCEHGNACRAQLVRLRGRNYGDEENIPGWIDELAAALGCAECELWEEDIPTALVIQNYRLRRAAERNADVIESLGGQYRDAWFENDRLKAENAKLRELAKALLQCRNDVRGMGVWLRGMPAAQ